MPWKVQLVIVGRQWALTCLHMVSGFVELTCLFIMRLVRCCPQSGEEWALFLLGGGSHCVGLVRSRFLLVIPWGIMLGILVKVSWPWSLSFSLKGASGFATKFCGFWKD